MNILEKHHHEKHCIYMLVWVYIDTFVCVTVCLCNGCLGRAPL